MKEKNVEAILYSTAGVAAMFVILIAFYVVTSPFKARLDLTAEKAFTLSAGTHQLIIRGRAANTTLGTISIAATPPTIQIQTAAGGSVGLSIVGQPGQTYNVLSSQDLTTWALIGTVTLDANGSSAFTDPAGTSLPCSYYRLQGQ